jgi:hypothetical protein
MFVTLMIVSTGLGIVHSYHPQEGLGTYPEVAPFTAAPAVIRAGGTATLSWASRGAESLILVSIPEGLPGAAEEVRVLPPAGTITVRPLATTRYLMRCVTVSSGRMCNKSETTIDVKGTVKEVPHIIESGFGGSN